MSFRITTNGSMRLYKSNLMKSYNKLTSAGEKVMTNRKFNSYAEDPASASQAFQMRRTLWLTESQLTNNNAVSNTYDVAWKAIDKVQNDLGYQGIRSARLKRPDRFWTAASGPDAAFHSRIHGTDHELQIRRPLRLCRSRRLKCAALLVGGWPDAVSRHTGKCSRCWTVR